MDFTGCGNTLNMQHPRVLQLIMDSLRYWVIEMHVDGFRFDLASTLARELYEVNKLGAFFDIIHQDPVLSQVKLIAEPWDVGAGRLPGRQLPGAAGPSGTASTATASAASGRATAARRREFATRLTGSQRPVRVERPPARTPASTSSPATTASRCKTWSATTTSTTRPTARTTATAPTTTTAGTAAPKGPTDDPAINALRERQKRNLMATLLLSQGVPMLAGRRRARPHAERQQQRLLPGQRADLAELGAGRRSSRSSWSSSARSSRIWQRAAGLPAAASSSRAGRIRGSRHQGHLLVRPVRQGDDRRGLERRLRQVPGRAPGRRPDRRRRRARRADRRRHAAAPAQRPSRADPVHAAGDARRSSVWERVLDTADGRRRRRDPCAAATCIDLQRPLAGRPVHARRAGGRAAGLDGRGRALRREARRPEPPVPGTRRPRCGRSDASARPSSHVERWPSGRRGRPRGHRRRDRARAGPCDRPAAYAEELLAATPRAARPSAAAARVDLPPPVPRRLHLPRRRRDRPLPARPGHHRTATPRPISRPGPAARTATTSPTTASSTPRSAREEDYDAWVDALREHGLGQILDIVPNHMGIVGNENAWWNDVLENGPASPYAGYFDIDWSASPRPENCRTASCCRSWASRTARCWRPGSSAWRTRTGRFHVHYFEHRFPLDPDSYRHDPRASARGAASAPWAPSTEAVLEYQSILTAIRNLPDRTETEPGQRRRAAAREGGRSSGGWRRSLAEQRRGRASSSSRPSPLFNGTPGDPRSFDLLDELLDEQAYRLAYWRVAADEINYRRFFDVNDLAALSMERAEVFARHPRADPATCWPRARSTACGSTTPTACYDPQAVPRAAPGSTSSWRRPRGLRRRGPDTRGRRLGRASKRPLRERIAAGSAPDGAPARRPLYVVVEKILGADEPLAATTGRSTAPAATTS